MKSFFVLGCKLLDNKCLALLWTDRPLSDLMPPKGHISPCKGTLSQFGSQSSSLQVGENFPQMNYVILPHLAEEYGMIICRSPANFVHFGFL